MKLAPLSVLLAVMALAGCSAPLESYLAWQGGVRWAELTCESEHQPGKDCILLSFYVYEAPGNPLDVQASAWTLATKEAGLYPGTVLESLHQSGYKDGLDHFGSVGFQIPLREQPIEVVVRDSGTGTSLRHVFDEVWLENLSPGAAG